MDLEIQKLSPELCSDYLTYFDQMREEDYEDFTGCYCVWYHWCEQHETERATYEKAGGNSFKRELAMRLINEGKLQGYLAYQNGQVIGWVNTNDKESYDRLSRINYPELWQIEDSLGQSQQKEKVKSIVCYSIAPEFRRQGIAGKLLERVYEDARQEGYDYVEAYPSLETENIHRNYHGPLGMYEKQGFQVVKEFDDAVIVRKSTSVKRISKMIKNTF